MSASSTSEAELSVYAGRQRLGSIVSQHSGGWAAFDADGNEIGFFATMKAAIAAIPGRPSSPAEHKASQPAARSAS